MNPYFTILRADPSRPSIDIRHEAIGKKGLVPRIGNGVDMVNLLVYGKGAES